MKDIYLIGNLPGWVVALAALGVGALLVHQFRSLKQRLAVGPTSFLVALRTCVYSLLIFFLLGPSLVENRVTKLRPPLTVLIDTSQSMAFPANSKAMPEGKPGKSRIDLVKEKLLGGGKESLIQRLNREYDLRLYRFGTSLEPISPE
ncbi:MAG TPA: hypothetical protein VMO00_13460, partial [Methylomirabilota bacterium]|nr:hypothetical protein [Methylomirabilota bacterium]